MAIVLAIDPGYEKSAWLVYDTVKKEVIFADIKPNEEIVQSLSNSQPKTGFDILVIEMVESQGMPVGKSVFETVFWIGRFVQAYQGKSERIYRSLIKMHLCNSMRARDSNIRQALIDRFGSTREKAIGTKKQKGPLYGIKKDLWAALAVAIVFSEI